MNLRLRRPTDGAARLRTVFDRSLHDQRRGLIGWIIGIGLLAVWLLAMYPTIKNNPEMENLANSYPKALREMFNIEDFTSGPGYLRAEVFSFTVPVLLVIVAVLWGSDAIAGEEERRTIDLLLANPVSRRRVVVEKWAAVTVAVLSVSVAAGLTLTIGAPVVGLDIAFSRLIAAIVASALLAVMFATLALAVGAATGRRGLARGVAVALAVAAYLVSSLADLVSWLRPLRQLSPWHHALGVDPLGSGLSAPHSAVLIALSVALVVIGALSFERRDLVL